MVPQICGEHLQWSGSPSRCPGMFERSLVLYIYIYRGMCVNPVDYRYLKITIYHIYIYTYRCIMIYPAELPKLADFHNNIANDLGHNPTSMSKRWDGAQLPA